MDRKELCRWSSKPCRRKWRVSVGVSRPGMMDHFFGLFCLEHLRGLRMYFGDTIIVVIGTRGI